MKCLILAAGYATRLYPLTENFPKPLLKVGEKTILDWLVDDVSPVIDEFIVVSNHKFAHHFEAWAATKPQPITVVDDGTSTNETRLGAVKDIALGLQNNEDDVLVMAGDNVLDFSLLLSLIHILSLLADGKIDYISVREKIRLSPFAVNDPSGEIEKMIED